MTAANPPPAHAPAVNAGAMAGLIHRPPFHGRLLSYRRGTPMTTPLAVR